jgi:hypothetical protein
MVKKSILSEPSIPITPTNLNVLKLMNAHTTELAPSLNTGTILDLMTGKYRLYNDTYLLNGGLNFTTGITGINSSFKSGLAQSLATRVLNIYPDSTLNYHETELHLKDLERFDQVNAPNYPSVTDRIVLNSITEYDLIKQNEFLKELIDTKTKYQKELTIETPFLSYTTKQPIKMLIPTLIIEDSWSNNVSIVEQDMFTNTEIGDSKQNVSYLKDGLYKTTILRNIIAKAAKASIYFIFIAHKGKKNEIGGFAPPTKDYQFMKQDEKLKDVGANFSFLMMTLINAASVKILLDPDKNCLYPSNINTASQELSEVTYTIVKCKGNIAGTSLPFVMSQNHGYLSGLSHFHYLKNLKDYGIIGTSKYKLKLYPTLTFTRKDIRNQLKDNYEFERALDLTAQLAYIQSSFGLSDSIPENLNIGIDDFVVQLTTNKNIMMSDILNSRSYWTYNKDEIRPYMTIFDILKLIKKN